MSEILSGGIIAILASALTHISGYLTNKQKLEHDLKLRHAENTEASFSKFIEDLDLMHTEFVKSSELFWKAACYPSQIIHEDAAFHAVTHLNKAYVVINRCRLFCIFTNKQVTANHLLEMRKLIDELKQFIATKTLYQNSPAGETNYSIIYPKILSTYESILESVSELMRTS